MNKQIKVITYEQDRLYFFVDQVSLAQKKYDRLFKTFKDATYLSEGAQFLSDAGRELQFYKDVVEMFDKGYRKQSEGEWISVEDRLPDRPGKYLVYTWHGYILICNCCDYLLDGDLRFDDVNVTHWMPLPEPPKMEGGE